jgi:hypothetical protein
VRRRGGTQDKENVAEEDRRIGRLIFAVCLLPGSTRLVRQVLGPICLAVQGFEYLAL